MEEVREREVVVDNIFVGFEEINYSVMEGFVEGMGVVLIVEYFSFEIMRNWILLRGEFGRRFWV